VKPVIVVRNEPEAPAGYLGEALDRRGIDWNVVRVDEGESLPDCRTVSGVAVLGGAMGAYDEAAFPFLNEEKRLMAACVAAGIPVLGICLGCQLLADALGGRAYRADSAEVAFAPVELSDAGRSEPVALALAGRRILRFHRDTFTVPPGATLLATGGGYAQVFRIGSALGIQPHPEVTAEILADWLAGGDARRMAIDAGTDPVAIVEAFRSAQASVEVMAADVFDAWIDEVSTAQPRARGVRGGDRRVRSSLPAPLPGLRRPE
jgi:GMP synthase (glutamine-hydrolysing)